MEKDSVDSLNEDLTREYPGIDPAVEGIVTRIHRLSKYIKKSLGDTAATLGLDLDAWDILANLHCLEGSRSLSPGQLSTKVQLSSGAMTNRLDKLEEAGLIVRRPDPKDRRGIQVEATEAGRALWDKAVDIQAAKEKMFAQPLTQEEKEVLNSLLRKMMLSFESPQPRAAEPATHP